MSDACEQLFGPPVQDRDCGDCTACCKLLTIDHPDLKKPADVLCEHCTGNGCGIYPSRPSVCRDWYCLWRRIGAMPPETRPDRMGVMFELTQPVPAQNILSKLYIRGHALHSENDFFHPLVVQTVMMFRQGMIPVWLDHAGQKRLVHPGNAIAEVLLYGIAPANAEIAAKAEEWRAIYEAI